MTINYINKFILSAWGHTRSSISEYNYDRLRKHHNSYYNYFIITIIKQLFNTGKIKFYCRHVDGTLLLIKPEDIQLLQDLFNCFHKNIIYIFFKNEVRHFLNIKMSAQGLIIYSKNTHTGQYVHYDSFTPWNYNFSWIHGFVKTAK